MTFRSFMKFIKHVYKEVTINSIATVFGSELLTNAEKYLKPSFINICSSITCGCAWSYIRIKW